jgi:hypothetical protein
MRKFDELTRLPEFDKDLKHLLKRFRTLEDDLTVFINTQLFLYPVLIQITAGSSALPI